MLHQSPPGHLEATPLLSRNFVLLCLQSFVLYVGFYFLLPTLPLYQQELGGQVWMIGALSTVFTVAAVLSRMILGQAADRWGRRGLLLGGMALFTAVLPLYLLASSELALFPLRALHGVGWAAVTTASSTLAADFAPASRRGEALGYFVAMPIVGLAIGPQIGLWLSQSYGFPGVFWAAAVVGVLGLIVAALIAVPSRDPVRSAEPLTVRDFISTRVKRPSLALVSVNITYAGIVVFVPLHFQSSPQYVAVFFLVFALSILAVRPLSGRLSDVVGRQPIILPGLLVAAIGFALVGAADSLPMLALAGFVYALSFGAIYPALMALAVDLVRQHERGVAMGTFMAAFDAGIAIGSLSIGLVAQFVGYRAAFWAGALVPLGGLVYFVIATQLSIRARRIRAS